MTAYNGAINELLAIVWIDINESGSNIVWSISIPKLAIDSTPRWYVSGHTLDSSGDYSGAALLISKAGFHNYQLKTQNISRAFHINWYYR